MARHKWVNEPASGVRRCSVCGAEQGWTNGRYWTPRRIGPCRPTGKTLAEILAQQPETVEFRNSGSGVVAKIITKQLTRQQAARLAKSLAADAEFEDWLRNSPSMGSLRNTAGLIGECVQDLQLAVKRHDWKLVELAAGRLGGYAGLLGIMADAKKP